MASAEKEEHTTSPSGAQAAAFEKAFFGGEGGDRVKASMDNWTASFSEGLQDHIIVTPEEKAALDACGFVPAEGQTVIVETPEVLAEGLAAMRAAVDERRAAATASPDGAGAKQGHAAPWAGLRPAAEYSDAKLLRFVRSRKYDAGRAAELLEVHERAADEEGLRGLDSHDVRESLAVPGMRCCPGLRDRQGRQVIDVNMTDDDFMAMAKLGTKAYTRFVWWLFEAALEDEATQRAGFVFLCDFDRMTLSWGTMIKFREFAVAMDELAMKVLVNHLGARVGGYILVNERWYISWGFSIIKMFLKEKLRKRFHMLGNDVAGLQRFVAPECLPPSLGGTYDESRWTKWLEERQAADEARRAVAGGAAPSGAHE